MARSIKNLEDRFPPALEGLEAYAGRWIAYIGGSIVAQGGTPEQALRAAKAGWYKETPRIYYVPMHSPFKFSKLLKEIVSALPTDRQVYLVGGLVRDFFLNRETKDYDFVLDHGSLEAGRRVADHLGAAYYPLDEARQTARVILVEMDGSHRLLDFALQRGPNLESDLRNRDFTINALAIDLNDPEKLLDPLGGLADLHNKLLRSCSPNSFEEDPLRILRGVRLAAALNFRITPETLNQMRQSVPQLVQVSSERLRDELFRILEGPQPATAIRALDILGVVQVILPELMPLKGITQSSPHVHEAWTHTLETISKLESVLEVLSRDYNPDSSANLMMGLVSMHLGRYRQQIYAHLSERISSDRKLQPLLFLAALYHDAGKPVCRQLEEDGRIRFLGHEVESRRLVGIRAHALHMSSEEVNRLENIVGAHLRPLSLSQTNQDPSRKAIYRFFRDLGAAGVDVCLLSLADTLATYGSTLPQEFWNRQLRVIRLLLEAWWEKPAESVSPPELLRGGDLIRELLLEPGPLIGKLLEAIRESQATGEVQSYADALKFARRWIESKE